MTKANNYIEPKAFHAEYQKALDAGEPTRKLLLMFEKIAIKYSTKYRCKNKQDTDACVNFALTEAWIKWKKFDPEKSNNIFAFFTQMIKNDLYAQYNLIHKNKKLNISIDAIFPNGS